MKKVVARRFHWQKNAGNLCIDPDSIIVGLAVQKMWIFKKEVHQAAHERYRYQSVKKSEYGAGKHVFPEHVFPDADGLVEEKHGVHVDGAFKVELVLLVWVDKDALQKNREDRH